MKIISFIVTLYILLSPIKVFCQSISVKALEDSIKKIDSDNISPKQKLNNFYNVKSAIEKNGFTNDSLYALILVKIAKYETTANHNTLKTIDYLNQALDVNRSLGKKSSNQLNISICYSLGYYYQQENLYRKALIYFDSTTFFCSSVDYNNFYKKYSLFAKASIYLSLGDYQKSIDECNTGILYSVKFNDTANYIFYLNRKAWASNYAVNNKDALIAANKAMLIAARRKDFFELNLSYKTIAFAYKGLHKFDSALFFYAKTIQLNLTRGDFAELSDAYIYLGDFFLNSTRDYDKAIQNFKYSLQYAKKLNDNAKQASALNNMGEAYLLKKDLSQAGSCLLQAFTILKIYLNNNILNNANSLQLNSIEDKDMLIDLMINKTLLHLSQYKKTNNLLFINKCLETAYLTDSVITQLRHEQTADKSKLYWRIKTNNFFSAAVEASFLANKPDIAFFFMEKSRSVLLNDKLNELNASSYLSKVDATKQEDYEMKIIDQQQKISTITDTSKHYQDLQLQLSNIKNDYEQFIKSLEKKYPAYYQYKYEDDVPSLKNLQQYLAKNNQSFVHYFLGDTATYILAITSNNTQLIKLSQKDFNKNQLSQFLQFCANKQALLHHYDSFALLSNSIYETIFQPLHLPAGRTIICSDNIVIPFDALCTDGDGKNFLLSKYSFSYVYSARFLMKQFQTYSATGNFLGFAPVSYASYLHAPELVNAATALIKSSSYYNDDKLFTESNATKSNFLNYASHYTVVNIFSHAHGDTTDNEPVLFMQDSLIHLSDLQLLNDPATKLVLLSACQTNVGKAATGEGIYSLARGFATAGIPSVAATLWNADEQAIYAISEKFNQYLSQGMNKDEALQKAKLGFIQSNNSEKMLPYYWANMILIGNTDSLKFETASSHNYIWWIIAAGIMLFVALLMIIKFKSKKD